MIIYLYGPDAYRRREKLKEIVGEYQKRHSNFTVEKFYLAETDDEWLRFKDFIDAQSLFGENKLAVVYETEEIKGKEVLELLKSLTKKEGITVLLSEEKHLGREYDFLKKKPVLNQEFANLTPRQFKSFIIEEAKKRALELTGEQADSCARLYAGDSWAAVTELEKMALLSHSEPSRTRRENLLRSFANAQDDERGLVLNLFSAIYSLGNGNLKNKLSILENLLDYEDAAKVFNLAAFSAKQKNKFADYDAAIKSGKLDYETALSDYILSF